MERIAKIKGRTQLADKAIHITVPASVAFDLGKMNKVTETVLGRLGCPRCHSGFDLRFDFEKRFAFNENLEMLEHYH